MRLPQIQNRNGPNTINLTSIRTGSVLQEMIPMLRQLKFLQTLSPSKLLVLPNIKTRDTLFGKVKSGIVNWCHNKNVKGFSIYFLAIHSARR